MTTDTRTNEQIVQDRLTMMPKNERAYVAAKAVEVLRTAGRLVGEPAEAQVGAVAKAIYGDDPAWGYVNDYGYGEVASQWRHLGESVQEMFRLKARAALVAAAGAGKEKNE